MAAAAAPMRMLFVLLLFGLLFVVWFCVMAQHRIEPLMLVELSIGMPATTNRGCALPDSDLIPRIRIYADAPGAPELETICTFGAFAASALTMFGSLAWAIAADSPVLITVPSFSRVVSVPAPVMTTSPS